jgi:hypothetical protein
MGMSFGAGVSASRTALLCRAGGCSATCRRRLQLSCTITRCFPLQLGLAATTLKLKLASFRFGSPVACRPTALVIS